MSISPQDIQNREFREAFRGYNEDDVDTFLDQVAEEFGRLFQENQRIRIELAAAQQELARLGDRPRAAGAPTIAPAPPPTRPADPGAKAETREEMKRALLATQRAAEAALEEAKRRGAELVARAEQRAREIDELTARRAKEVDSDASSVLTQARQRIDELRHQENEIRLRLRRMLAEHVKVLQQLEGGDTAATGGRAAPGPVAGGQSPPAAELQLPTVAQRMAHELGSEAAPASRSSAR